MAGAASSMDGAKKPRSTLHISDTWSLMRERHERQIPAIDVVQCRGTYLFGPMYVAWQPIQSINRFKFERLPSRQI